MSQKGLYPRRPDGQQVENQEGWWWYCDWYGKAPNHHYKATCSQREKLSDGIEDFPCQKPDSNCGWIYDPSIF